MKPNPLFNRKRRELPLSLLAFIPARRSTPCGTPVLVLSRTLAIFVLLTVCSRAAYAADPVSLVNVVLLQPDSVLSERVGEVKSLAEYMKGVIARIGRSLAEAPDRTPAGGFVVLAIRPGHQSRVWLDLEPQMAPSTRSALRESAVSVHPPAVRGGPVVFALKVSVWGGVAPDRVAPRIPEWSSAVARAGQPLEVGDILDRIWDSGNHTPQ